MLKKLLLTVPLSKECVLYSLITFVCSPFFLRAQNPLPKDTVVEEREVRKYIRSNIVFDYYGTPEKSIIGKYVLDKLKRVKNEEYQFKYYSFGFYQPLYTKTWTRSDIIRPTFHLLLTGDALIAQPIFTILKATDPTHNLYKVGIGLRAIYTDGSKNTLFASISPFVSQDNLNINDPVIRYASSFIFNRTVSPTFSYRFGYVKTFLLSDLAYHLPFFGIRIGRLDKTYFSFQLPRNISLNFPIVPGKIYGSLYSKPIGGIFNYSNTPDVLHQLDSRLQVNNVGNNVQFRFYEFLFGFLADFKVSPNFSFYVSTGFTYARNINFAKNNNNVVYTRPLVDLYIRSSLFLNFGLNLTFGRVKSSFNNYQLYDAFYLNKSFDPGDINIGSRELFISEGGKTVKKIKIKSSDLDYREIKDLIYDQE